MWRGKASESFDAAIGCEGGPVLVANADDFRLWTGGEPLPARDRTELHLWSPFTAELPEKFRPDGPAGHQFVPGASFDELVRLRGELLGYLRSRWPGVVVAQEGETWTARLPDGRELRVCLEPTSEYDRACRHLDEILLHRYAKDSRCVVWSVAAGIVNVRRTPGARRLELAQVFAEDEADERQALDYVSSLEADAEASAVVLEVAPGPTVIAWAPNTLADYDGELRWRDMTTRDPGKVLDLSTGSSGVLLALEAGTYGFVHGSSETERWSVRWCVAERGSAATAGAASS
jgi:hypothetical protein